MKLIDFIKYNLKHIRTNTNEITFEEACRIKKGNPCTIFLDVRSPQEYNEGHIDGAILIPLYELKYKIENIIPNKDTIIIAYCGVGRRSKKALEILRKMQYHNIYHIKDGISSISL